MTASADTGGICGRVINQTSSNPGTTLSNCYNAGTIDTTSSNKGALAGFGTPSAASVGNYYLDSSISGTDKSSDYSTPKTADELKAAAFLTLLNDGEYADRWIAGSQVDSTPAQEYPGLFWEGEAIVPVDKDDLQAAVDAADKDKDVVASEDGSDVPNGSSWATSETLDAYKKAVDDVIAAAQAVASNDKATQAQVDKAAEDVAAAAEKFEGAEKSGTKKNESDSGTDTKPGADTDSGDDSGQKPGADGDDTGTDTKPDSGSDSGTDSGSNSGSSAGSADPGQTVATVDKPTATSYDFDGTLKVGVPAGEGYELSDTYEATDPGSYTATAKLAANYAWSDGATEDVALTWSISEVKSVWKRLQGDYALDTMASIVNEGWSDKTGGIVVLTTADGYWDALSGAALCGKMSSVLVLAGDASSDSIGNFVASHGATIANAYVFGGPAAVDDATLAALESATS